MTPEHDDDVRALFDATASEASGPVLTKLKARAGDIPRTARRSWFARFAAPTFALVTGVAAAAVLLKATPDPTVPMTTAVAVATTESPASTASEAPALEPASGEEDSDEDLAGLEAVAFSDSDELWSGVGVDSDSESDDLLAALDSWMEDDG